MSLYSITIYTHAPKPAVNEISSPTIYTDTEDYIVSYCIVLYCMVSLTIVSDLMMAGLTMAETCS
jgi:hypothetical protein